MSDLISRKSVIEKLEKIFEQNLTLGETNLVSDIVAYIMIEPTAYDIDKVVSKIRRASGNGYRDIDGDYVPPMIETKEAIEIVKQCGVGKET